MQNPESLEKNGSSNETTNKKQGDYILKKPFFDIKSVF